MARTIAKPRFWTPIAIECYERCCVCNGCEYSRLEEDCRLKESVLLLVQQFGVSKRARQKSLIKEE